MLDLQVRSAHPPNCAPNQLFKLLRCFGRLIELKLKRSTFRFASLTLRTARRNLLSEGSGVPHGLFMISHHRPCGRWCFARLIRQAETLELQLHSQPPSKRTALSPLKRSCFRFAALTLRCRTEPALQAAPVFRMAYFPYLTAFRMQAKQIQRLPLRGAGAKRLKGGPWG